jgi:hypothetical protein
MKNIYKQTNKKVVANCMLEVRNRRDYWYKKFNRDYFASQFYKLMMIRFDVFNIIGGGVTHL